MHVFKTYDNGKLRWVSFFVFFFSYNLPRGIPNRASDLVFNIFQYSIIYYYR